MQFDEFAETEPTLYVYYNIQYTRQTKGKKKSKWG